MLFAIIGTIDGANFVFDRWPRVQQYPKITGKIKATELSEILIEYFYYFGMFRKSKVLQIESLSFTQKNFIQTFNANEKRLQAVLSIDDQYIFVSRSIFIVNNQKLFPNHSITEINSNFYTLTDINQQKKDIVNSLTLVWCTSSYLQAEQLKNKLSFMIGLLNNLQQSQNYLNKQIIKITQTKISFQKKLKQKQRQLNKDISLNYQQYQIKSLFEQFYYLSEQSIKQIEIFLLLQKFYYSCINHLEYQINQSSYSSIGGDYKIPLNHKYSIQDKKISDAESKTDQQFINKQTPPPPISIKKQKQLQILRKTTLTSEKKLQFLPKSLRDDRIHKLYNAALKTNDITLGQIISKQQQLSQQSSLKTIQFLEMNNACLCVYPFDIKKYYNLYTLKNMPSETLIKKFNTKIFPQDNILTEIYPFSQYKRINRLNEKLKYLIFQNIIKEVYVYIYYLDYIKQPQNPSNTQTNNLQSYHINQIHPNQQNYHNYLHNTHFSSNPHIEQQQQSESHDDENNKIQLLMNFINKPYNINEILNEQNQFQNISEVLNFILDKINHKKESQYPLSNNYDDHQHKKQKDTDHLTKPKWGFYYVQMG